MKKTIAVLLAVSLVLLSAVVFADDAPMALFGETLVPIKSSEIQLVDEDIDVFTNVNEFPGKASVTAVLRFKNLSDKDLTLLVGFPLDKEYNDTTEGEYYSTKQLDFKVEVNGNKVHPRTFYDKQQERTWFVWEQKFPAKKKVIIKHDYKVPTWGSNHIDPEGYDIQYFQYILTTGALWAGNIERATITIHFDKPLNTKYYYAIPKTTMQSAKQVKWVLKDFEPKSEVTFAYSWAKDTKKIFQFLKEQDQRAKTEGKSVAREIKDVRTSK